LFASSCLITILPEHIIASMAALWCRLFDVMGRLDVSYIIDRRSVY